MGFAFSVSFFFVYETLGNWVYFVFVVGLASCTIVCTLLTIPQCCQLELPTSNFQYFYMQRLPPKGQKQSFCHEKKRVETPKKKGKNKPKPSAKLFALEKERERERQKFSVCAFSYYFFWAEFNDLA